MPSFFSSLLFLAPMIQAHRAVRGPADAETNVNLIGALLFFTYIIAALFFSVYILLSITHISTNTQEQNQTRHGEGSLQSRRIQNTSEDDIGPGISSIFATLALTSFSVLSWNMLNFLIVSYVRWAADHDIEPAFNVGSLEQFRLQLDHIWAWSLDSNLFQTFAEDLTSEPVKWKLVQAALIYSYTWNSHMSALGHKHDVPDLWAYFVLDQILPVSFTQHLFCIALSRIVWHRPDGARTDTETGSNNDTRTGLGLRTLSLLCYCIGLYCIPATIGTQGFFPTLFALRVLLFTPFVLDRLTCNSRTAGTTSRMVKTFNFNKLLLIGSISFAVITLPLTMTTNYSTMVSQNDSYAAATLSSDMIIGVVGGVVIFWQGTKRGFQPFV